MGVWCFDGCGSGVSFSSGCGAVFLLRGESRSGSLTEIVAVFGDVLCRGEFVMVVLSSGGVVVMVVRWLRGLVVMACWCDGVLFRWNG